MDAIDGRLATLCDSDSERSRGSKWSDRLPWTTLIAEIACWPGTFPKRARSRRTSATWAPLRTAAFGTRSQRADVELRAARDHERRDDDHDVERVEEEHVPVCSTCGVRRHMPWRSSHPTAFSLRPS